jgi:hypothetical protein
VHLDYLGCRAEVLLDDTHPEQHSFAMKQVIAASHDLPTISQLPRTVVALAAQS